ncbi:DUF2461 domain-containing protein [Mucilaginibacter roseus]|uniref:DUF2461 domain-containing protein n=1 Tax=Mucilaginibacter roseus TaxID=1528868 RepID=A0ABS8U8P7_9SPHI|nr:DUF2461 domain-containing protein [Mucilaginibacter roseus]MCD8742367.1 DUF2461 domain-containing protein [Mucilaginibacter roseus]
MIKKETLDFLKELAQNNNRDWFMANKARHDAARENVIEFAALIIKEIGKSDPDINTEADPKKCVLRIYRDIRFSPDKTPYKKNFGITIPRQHPNGSRGSEYYVQIEPGNSFVAGGYWMPEGNHLKAIRQEIDYNAQELKDIVDAPEFVKLFGHFREQEKLKTNPRDYAADNENIELLKLKSFVAWRKLTDAEVVKKDLVAKVASLCNHIYPLNLFLNNAIV